MNKELLKKLVLIEGKINNVHRNLILLEKIEQKDIDKVTKSLNSLSSIAKEYTLPELSTGIQKANTDLMKAIAKKLFSKDVKKVITDVLALETSVINAFKILPKLLTLLNLSDEDKGKDEDLSKLLDDKTRKNVFGMFVQALKPESFFGLKGLPYININKFSEQLIDYHSYSELSKIADVTKSLTVIDSSEIEKITSSAEATTNKSLETQWKEIPSKQKKEYMASLVNQLIDKNKLPADMIVKLKQQLGT